MKSRVRAQYFVQGTKVTPYYIIDFWMADKKKYLPLGDSEGVMKFSTESEAEKFRKKAVEKMNNSASYAKELFLHTNESKR